MDLKGLRGLYPRYLILEHIKVSIVGIVIVLGRSLIVGYLES